MDETGGLHLSEVARRCGLPAATVHRVLSELVELGVVTRLGEFYVPGSRLLAMASGLSSGSAPVRRSVVLPSLLWLQKETGLAAAFSVLRYGQVCFESVAYVSGRVDRTATTPGWAPPYCTSSGKVLLAHSPQVARQVIQGWQPTRHTPRTIVDRLRLESELARIREKGLAYNDREYLPEVCSVAVPVVDPHLSFVAAIAVCGSEREVSAATVGPALHRTAWTVILALRRQMDIDSRR